jgi:pimeloyl-ACP methyl ester carboxylesterase
MTYLPAYLPLTLPLSRHITVGVSLGGHSSWLSVLHEPRVTAAVVIIGCPDYGRLMSHRAEKSKLKDWTDGVPVGSKFFGSDSFPKALVDAVSQTDPAALLFPDSPLYSRDTSFMAHALLEKRILCCSGGADKLVPYACSEPFLDYLRGIEEIDLTNKVYDGAGHEMTPAMIDDTSEWIAKTLSSPKNPQSKL